MRALLAGFLLTVLPVSAQWKIPDGLPPLPQDGEACNEKRTHCLVNFADWMAYKAAIEIGARRVVLFQERARELEELLEAERASKRKVCATVQRTASWRIVPR